MRNPPDTGKKILTLAETARWLKLSEVTILKLIKEKKIPAIKVGRQWRFSHDRLLKLFDPSSSSDGEKERVMND